MLFIMAFIALIAMIIMARKIITPIVTLKGATKKVSEENFAISLSKTIKRNDEIGQLAREFKKMTEQLAESNKMRKQFINDVSHDFQTPLQNIKGYVNLFHEERVPPAKRREYTEIIQSETKRLSVLTSQLLVVTSLDALTSSLEKEEVNISKQLQSAINNYRWLI